MKKTSKKLLSLLLALMMVMTMVTPVFATGSSSDNSVVTWSDLADIDETLVPDGVDPDLTLTVQEVIWVLLNRSGLTEEQLGEYPADYLALADSLGMIDANDTDPAADCTNEMLDVMLTAYEELSEAVAAEDKDILVLNGRTQPVFPYTTGSVLEGYSNAESDILRFPVYVETNYDTDNDGKLDLVKALVQIPRAAMEGDYKAATIYEARPYITGCTRRQHTYYEGALGYDVYTNTAAPRGAAAQNIDSWASAEAFVNAAQSSDWYYWNPDEKVYVYEDLEWYDYYLVRGYAVVECGGLGTKGSEGFETCGSNVEIDAFKCVIEWLNGAEGRKAYTDKTGTTSIDAYWSNGKVGMTGRSYAGTTQFGLATTGVEGLETIVPVAGIASWYEYTNSQGVSTRSNVAYTNTLAAYCAARIHDEADYATIKESYGKYLTEMKNEQIELNGDYGTENDHWAIRDYTLDAENIKCSALIVHGLSDYNVRPKHFQMMYDAFVEADKIDEVKLLLHQDGHLTPTYPAGGYAFTIGDQTYDELLNQWFSHYLYDVENGIEDMAAVTAQDSHSNTWNTYDSWDAAGETVLKADVEEETTTITSNYSANGITSRNWQTELAAGSTPCSVMYVGNVAEDMTIKGVVEVNFSATVANEKAAEPAPVNAPKGDYIDPDNFAASEEFTEAGVTEGGDTISTPDGDVIDRDALMVSAMLVDISGDGETFPVFNTSGSYVPKKDLGDAEAWQGGGLKNWDLKEMIPSEVTSKIVARGWMDLCNPEAGFASNTTGDGIKLVEGEYNNYTIYLQPNLYEVEAGHKLALVIYPYEQGMARYTQNYEITINNASVNAVIPTDEAEDKEITVGAPQTVLDTIKTLLENSGLAKEQLGTYPADYTAFAESLGMIDGTEDLDAICTGAQYKKMAEVAAALTEAVTAEVKKPLVLNGRTQPIFPYTSGAVDITKEGQSYSNAESDIIRYSVYVESDYDTDGDGKRDLVKALVQVPRAAMEGDYKAATIYEARPYITGCTPWGGATYGTEGYDIESMYKEVAPRGVTGTPIASWAAAEPFVNAAVASDWYYWNPYESMYDYEDLEWYDYYLVRGYAVVEAGGFGTKGSDGFETCGTDLEIESFKSVIEWLHGDRVAYTDKTGTTAIEAYWSNGKVGMTGRSYAGTTQFGLATTGVEGLETIVPVAGIASWYEYTNSQGISTNSSPAYSDTLAFYCMGRYLDEADYATIAEDYGNYLYQLQQDQLELNGDYGTDLDGVSGEGHWAIRDYTLDAENIKCSALIVHGLDDYNVRPKHFQMMYDAFKEAGKTDEVKLLLHQDGHLTPTYPAGGYAFMIGDQTYDELLNQWFSHYLYGVENGIEDMAAVTAQDSHSNTWNTYDSWEAAGEVVLQAKADTETTTISSDWSKVGVDMSSPWWGYFFDLDKAVATASTPCNAVYIGDVTKDITVKGVVEVNFSASVANEAPTAAAQAPRGTDTVVDHDNIVNPSALDHDNFVNPQLHNTGATISTPDAELIDRDALMVSAMLVDIAPEGETFPVFNTSGSYVNKKDLGDAEAWQGGGLKNWDLKEMIPENVSYKVVSYGWMDLCNPEAGFASKTAGEGIKLEAGKSYDYTIYLQPNLYEVEAGHKLAVVIYTYDPGMASYTQNYAVTINNSSVNAVIPTDEKGETEISAAYDAAKVDFTAKNVENGTIAASAENGKVVIGTEVTVTATADAGYAFTGWKVNGEVAETTENPAAFVINENTTVEAIFEAAASGGGSGSGSGSGNGGSSTPVTPPATDEPTDEPTDTPEATFADVDPAAWYAPAIETVVEAGLMNGVGDDQFAPNANLSRAMLAQIIYNMEKKPAVSGASIFTDVAADAWYADAVIWAAAEGIVTGYTDNTFRPLNNITREQLATMLYRYAGFPETDGTLAAFADAASVSEYAAKAMAWAVEKGIINGTGNNTLNPQGLATRAQAAQMLANYLAQ